MAEVPKREEVVLQSCPQASRERVNLTALQEKVSAMVTSVTCGERLQDVSESLNRAGSSVRIRPVCLPELVRNTSAEYLPILPRWGTVCRGEYGELATSEHLTSETGCSLLPTPTASEGFAYMRISKRDVQTCVYKQHHPKERGKISGHTKRLVEYFAYFGIPLLHICDLQEMIMGFPKGYTDLDVSGTR